MGEFLGLLIIVFYSLALAKYFFKWINKLFQEQLSKNDKVYIIYKKIFKVFMKYHSIFGFLAVLFILLHFFVQFTSIGLNIYGVLAASAMIFQVMLGIYGTKVKNKFKYWALIHRILAVLILLMILIHVN